MRAEPECFCPACGARNDADTTICWMCRSELPSKRSRTAAPARGGDLTATSELLSVLLPAVILGSWLVSAKLGAALGFFALPALFSLAQRGLGKNSTGSGLAAGLSVMAIFLEVAAIGMIALFIVCIHLLF